MGEVVPFPGEARRRAPLSRPEGPAQILFFLGVRYCREEDGADKAPNRRRGGSASPRPRRRKRA